MLWNLASKYNVNVICGYMSRRGKYENEKDRWEDKNRNKTHQQCPFSSHTSPT